MLLTRMQIDILVKLTDADTHYFSRSVERLKRANYAEDCSKLLKMQPYHPVFLFVFSQRRRLFFNTTHFTLIQLHKVTPGSSSIQIQCSSAGAGGVKCFLSRTPPERSAGEERPCYSNTSTGSESGRLAPVTSIKRLHLFITETSQPKKFHRFVSKLFFRIQIYI